MSDKNTGGAAFPQREQVGDIVLDKGGMTLRDYFAAKADLSKEIESDGCIEQRLAILVMDCGHPPCWDSDHLNARKWWYEAECRVRYMKADAMLRARENT